jgi:uncharacterized protein (DUF1499 family)
MSVAARGIELGAPTHTGRYVTPIARWSSRLALFFVSLLLVTLVLHRLGLLPTVLALNLFAVGYVGAALGLAIGLVALARIWRTGEGGAGNLVVGILLPLAAMAGPFAVLVISHDLPRLNDVTTDLVNPPQFKALASREKEANPSSYAAGEIAALQAAGYPDVRTFVLARSVDDAFELVEEIAKRLRWRVTVAEVRAGRPPAKTAVMEATDHTLLVGFPDDIVVRIEGTNTLSRIDVRSASRYGKFDFGQNAARIRRFLSDLALRAEATGPSGVGGRALRNARARALLKRQKERDQRKGAPRPSRGRGQ